MESAANEQEYRERQGEKIVTFLNRIDAYNFFRTLKQSKESASRVTFDEFKNFLIRINGIARDISISKREFDGDGVKLEGFIDSVEVVCQEDKEALLQSAFEAIPKLSNPDDAAYLIPAVITGTHPFEDANGRTSRVLNILLTSHVNVENFEQTLRLALGEDGRYDALDINPSYIDSELEDVLMARHHIGEDAFSSKLTRLFTNERSVSNKAKEFESKCRNEPIFGVIVLTEFFHGKNIADSMTSVKADFPDMNLEDDYRAVSLTKMEALLQEADWDILMANYFKLKKEMMELLIDVFVHSDNYVTHDGTKKLRELFLEKVHAAHEKNKLT